MNKTVDVLMPVYNIIKYKNFLIKAIYSVINQNYKKWKLIIIDDFSNDGTYEFLVSYVEKLKNDKIKLFRNTCNKGCYVSLNEAILKSTGDYITRIDSDDYFHHDKLLKQVNILENKNIIATYCSNKIVSTNKITFFNCVTLMFRRRIINEIGYYDSVRFGADSEFLDRIVTLYKNNIFGLKTVLYYVNKRYNSLTTSIETGNIKNTPGKLIREDYKKRYKKWHKNKKLFIPYPLTERLF